MESTAADSPRPHAFPLTLLLPSSECFVTRSPSCINYPVPLEEDMWAGHSAVAFLLFMAMTLSAVPTDWDHQGKAVQRMGNTANAGRRRAWEWVEGGYKGWWDYTGRTSRGPGGGHRRPWVLSAKCLPKSVMNSFLWQGGSYESKHIPYICLLLL